MLIKQINTFDKYFKEFFEGVYEFNRIIGNDENDKSLIPLYTELLREEAGEMAEAKTAEEQLDSIVDVMVVGSFLAKLLGYKLQYYEENAYVDDYCGVMEAIMWWCSQEQDVEQSMSYVEDVMAIFLTLDIDHIGALREVNNSNFSKFIKVSGALSWEQEECYDLICKSIVDKGRYTDVVWQRVGDYIVFKDGKGKCLKAPCFCEPAFSKFIN